MPLSNTAIFYTVKEVSQCPTNVILLQFLAECLHKIPTKYLLSMKEIK